jgi:methylamine dehydrogenase accessory protein MauD
MSNRLLTSNLILWDLVLFLGFLLVGALRALALIRWQVAQHEATMPSRIGRSGLRAGKKAPQFTLPAIAGRDVKLQDYAGKKLLLVSMQPGCGPCHGIVSALNRLHDTREVQVLVLHNGDKETVRKWVNQLRPQFTVAVQDHFNVSKHYEVFATPFAFLIDERGVIAARGIVSTKEYLGFVLTRARYVGKEDEDEAEAFQVPQPSLADSGQSSLSYSKELEHV